MFLKRALFSGKGLALLRKLCCLETALVSGKKTSFFLEVTIFSRKGFALLKRHCFQERALVSSKTCFYISRKKIRESVLKNSF